MKYLFYIFFLSLFIASFNACIKKEDEPIKLSCNNLEDIGGKCGCPKNKWRLNDVCQTPDATLYYGTGNTYGYFDTTLLRTLINPSFGNTPNYFIDTENQNYGGGGACSYYTKASGDSIVFFQTLGYNIRNIQCYAIFHGKYSVDKREIKMKIRWVKPITWEPVDSSYMTLRNYVQ
jgi:hypothetical protein